MTVVFLDIDGVVITERAKFLAPPGETPEVFDPCGVALLLRLLILADAKLVISSEWRKFGRERIVALLAKNGIPERFLAEDWSTGPIIEDAWGRDEEIIRYLARHPQIQRYVVFEDKRTEHLENVVRPTQHDGIQMGHYMQAGELLGLAPHVLLHRTVDLPPPLHTLTAIGWTGNQRVYLDLSLEDAKRRFAADEGALHPEMTCETLTVTDTFKAYEIWGIV